MQKTLRIGLTGGMGAGKSLVLEILLRKGVPILQTDHLGHRLLEQEAFSKLMVRHFGKGILGEGGRINRKELGRLVFGNPLKQKKINKLMHPWILRQVGEWAKRQAKKVPRPPVLVVEVPLLFESGSDRLFDRVLCVSAPLDLRRKRLLQKGLSLGEIKRREKSQWPQSRKNEAADWVIFNRGSRKELEYAVNRWLESVKKS